MINYGEYIKWDAMAVYQFMCNETAIQVMAHITNSDANVQLQ